jgi:hypothetical protein
MIITPVTELDAVNEILSAVGDSPVNSIENPKNVNVINAIRMLRLVTRKQQSRGWFFNSYSSYVLNPDVFTKKIRWQDNFLQLEGSNGETFIKRGDYLYDKDNLTDTFTGPVTVDVLLQVPFTDLPEQLRHYITAKAAKDFQTRYLGDAALAEELARDEVEAYQALIDADLEINDYNMLDNTSVMELRRR